MSLFEQFGGIQN